MTFTAELPLVEEVEPVYSLHCDYCGRTAPGAETKVDAVLLALKNHWKIRLKFFSAETEFVALSDLIGAIDTSDVFCPACLKREFE